MAADPIDQARELLSEAKQLLDDHAEQVGEKRYLDAARFSLGVVDGQLLLHILEAS